MFFTIWPLKAVAGQGICTATHRKKDRQTDRQTDRHTHTHTHTHDVLCVISSHTHTS